jgi:sugar lactone lactonase YvrE
LPYFSQGDATVARAGTNPTLLLSSDFPLSVGHDGSLYYPWLGESKQVRLYRLASSGSTTVFTVPPEQTESGPLRWLNGLAVAPDGSVYYTENLAVRRILPDGKIETVFLSEKPDSCKAVPALQEEQLPYFRGLDVDQRGNVYVAATGCGAVWKITPDKKLTVILQATGPWAPTGVALFGSEVYVLEYLHTPGDNRREWLPRVRRVSKDGRVVTLATIER